MKNIGQERYFALKCQENKMENLMNDHTNEERRKEQRVKKDFSMICKAYRKTDIESDLSRITDLSLKGLSFISDGKLDDNVILQIIFRVPPDFKEKIELFAKIVNCSETDSNKFRISVTFIDMNPNIQNLLNRVIEQSKI